MKKQTLPVYTDSEELFNTLTHALGGVLGVIGTVFLTIKAASFHSNIAVVASIIYGISITILFSMSALYHSIKNEKIRPYLRIVDHSSIFLLIAGSYTPYTLIALKGSFWGMPIFITIWIAAILGITLNIINLEKYKKISLILYVLMGWAALIDIVGLFNSIPRPGFILLVLGGVAYTVGIIFYKMKRIPYMHGVWHLFVLLAAVLHYISIYRYVIPLAS